jgi:hypothetical protein
VRRSGGFAGGAPLAGERGAADAALHRLGFTAGYPAQAIKLHLRRGRGDTRDQELEFCLGVDVGGIQRNALRAELSQRQAELNPAAGAFGEGAGVAVVIHA